MQTKKQLNIDSSDQRCVKYARIRFFLNPYFPVLRKNRRILVREIKGQKKPAFWHILRSTRWWQHHSAYFCVGIPVQVPTLDDIRKISKSKISNFKISNKILLPMLKLHEKVPRRLETFKCQNYKELKRKFDTKCFWIFWKSCEKILWLSVIFTKLNNFETSKYFSLYLVNIGIFMRKKENRDPSDKLRNCKDRKNQKSIRLAIIL